jgi:hypothetical protein
MYGLLRSGLDRQYSAVVWRLALRVVEIHRSYWVEPLIPDSPDDLRNVFLDRST